MPKLTNALKKELAKKTKAYESGEITFDEYAEWCKANGFIGGLV